MARTRHYRGLLVWQKTMELARETYLRTEEFPESETFGLRMQMRRSAVSVASNIAEGHGRLTDPQLKNALGMARGSLYELQTQTELANAPEFHGCRFRSAPALGGNRNRQTDQRIASGTEYRLKLRKPANLLTR